MTTHFLLLFHPVSRLPCALPLHETFSDMGLNSQEDDIAIHSTEQLEGGIRKFNNLKGRHISHDKKIPLEALCGKKLDGIANESLETTHISYLRFG